MGDFTGFTFGGYASSDLGITRVSGGDRYEEELHPEIKDRTAEVPGLNGEYYFGSDYGTRTFDIEFAFDHLTEEQFRKLRQVFGTKKIQQLIFDERPYKYYMAKIESPIELSYICFEEPDYEWQKIPLGYNEYVKGIGRRDYEYKVYTDTLRRVYKGEGRVTFVCYFPFAKSAFKQCSYQKTVDDFVHNDKTYYAIDSVTRTFIPVVNPDRENLSSYYEEMTDTISGWAAFSGILSSQAYRSYDKYIPARIEDDIIVIPAHINLYNGGDLPTGFRLYCPFPSDASSDQTYDITISYTVNGQVVHSLQIVGLKKIGDDEGFLINTDNGLVQGVTNFSYIWSGDVSYFTTGNIYNQYVVAGLFFKIDPTTTADSAVINIDSTIEDEIEIFYDYLYF